MAHPHPEGEGALIAIDRALERAQLDAASIDYVNLHGTATPANDRIENHILAKRFSGKTLASSSKGWTGHALGAAGILESVISFQAMEHGLVPGTLNCEELDQDMAFPVTTGNVETQVHYALCNSFGFGGNNASLIFGRIDA
jgi:3-oxoacyl-[acyl-carrier-protein] synthase-1